MSADREGVDVARGCLYAAAASVLLLALIVLGVVLASRAG